MKRWIVFPAVALALWTGAASAAASGQAATPSMPEQMPILQVEVGMHTGRISGFAVAPGAEAALTASPDRSIRLWNLETGRAIGAIRLPMDTHGEVGVPTAIALFPNGKSFLAASRTFDAPRSTVNHSLYLVLANSGTVVYRKTGMAPVWDMDVAPDGRFIGVAHGEAGFVVYSSDGLTEVGRGRAPSSGDAIRRIAFTTRDRLVTLSTGGALEFYQVVEGALQHRGSAAATSGREPFSIAFSVDGRSLAVGYTDSNTVDVYDGIEFRHRSKLTAGAPDQNLAAVGWTLASDGREWLAAGGTARGQDGRNALFLWRDAAGDPAVLPVTDDAITAIRPAGEDRLAYAASDPAWGLVTLGAGGAPPTVTHANAPVTHDFRVVGPGRLLVSDDGGTVAARSRQGRLTFQLRELNAAAEETNGLRPARRAENGIVVEGDRQSSDFTVNGYRLTRSDGTPVLADFERVLSADASPRGDEAVLGTDYHLLTFDGEGRETGRLQLSAPVWNVAYSGTGQIIVATLGDGSLRWFAREPGGALAQIAGLFAEADGPRWIAWTPDGSFAHSDHGGADLLGYHLNGRAVPMTGQWVPFGALYEVFYKPERVASVIDEKPQNLLAARDSEILESLRQRPTLVATGWCGAESDKIAWTTRALASVVQEEAAPDPACGTVEPVTAGLRRNEDGGFGQKLPEGMDAVVLTVKVSDAGAGAEYVDALVNGRLAGRFDLSPEQRQEALGTEGATVSFEVALEPDYENRIDFRIYNTAGIYGEAEPLFFRTGRDAMPDARTLYVLAIGVDRYGRQGFAGEKAPDGMTPLQFAVKDSRSIADAIGTLAAESYDDIAEPLILTDEEATTGAIRAAIGQIAERADQNDGVVLYLAGHGVTTERNYIFVSYDVDTLDPERLEGVAVTEDLLLDAVADIRARNVLIMLDTCYAGGFRVAAPDGIAHASGHYVLTATASNEAALDHYPGADNGVFAYAVLEGLRGEAAVAGVVDALTLGTYVRQRVADLARTLRHDQAAVFKTAGGELREFPVANVAAGRLQ